MEGCHKVIKYLMVFFNFVFFVLGIAIMGVGIYARVKEDDFNAYFVVIDETNSTWENFGSLCIAVGVFVMILGGSGCYGAAKESRLCLGFFATLVFLVFILEVVAAGLGYHYHNSLQDTISTGMEKTFNRSLNATATGKDKEYHDAWHTVQKDLKCCGIKSPDDYTKRNLNPADYCPSNPQVPTHGCYSKVKDELTGKWAAWAGAAVGIAVVQLLAIIFSCLLIHEIGKGDSYTVV